jgi:hypothetical protein
MFVLNLVMTTCALSRELMSEGFEKKMKKCVGMGAAWQLYES